MKSKTSRIISLDLVRLVCWGRHFQRFFMMDATLKIHPPSYTGGISGRGVTPPLLPVTGGGWGGVGGSGGKRQNVENDKL